MAVVNPAGSEKRARRLRPDSPAHPPELPQAFAQHSDLPFLGLEIVEQRHDISEGAQAGVLVIPQVGDVAQAGDAGLVKKEPAGPALKTTNKTGAQEFFDHLGVESGESSRFVEIAEQRFKRRGLADAGELVTDFHDRLGLGLLRAGVGGRAFCQGFPLGFFARGDLVGNGDADDGVEVPAGQAAVLDA